MHRVTVTLDDELMADLDRLIASRGYQNRSEAIRDLARAGLAQMSEPASEPSHCVGALVYVYDHAQRDLARRLTDNAHHHHDIALATLHVHLDNDLCMEMTALRGTTSDVQHFADHVIAERGVRYGRVVTIPAAGGTKKPHKHR
jgi:CopG family nickel-responsive transcriptional regulator